MLKRLLTGALLLLASTFSPLMADYTDLQPVATAVVNNQITIQVDNPNTSAESARIQVAVRVADGATEVLTTSTVTVAGTATLSVTVSATQPIVGIIDDPDPISP